MRRPLLTELESFYVSSYKEVVPTGLQNIALRRCHRAGLQNLPLKGSSAIRLSEDNHMTQNLQDWIGMLGRSQRSLGDRMLEAIDISPLRSYNAARCCRTGKGCVENAYLCKVINSYVTKTQCSSTFLVQSGSNILCTRTFAKFFRSGGAELFIEFPSES